MATVVNNPVPVAETRGNGFLIGVIILVAFVGVLLYFGISAINRMGPMQLNIPTPQINVPDKVDVNVN